MESSAGFACITEAVVIPCLTCAVSNQPCFRERERQSVIRVQRIELSRQTITIHQIVNLKNVSSRVLLVDIWTLEYLLVQLHHLFSYFTHICTENAALKLQTLIFAES